MSSINFKSLLHSPYPLSISLDFLSLLSLLKEPNKNEYYIDDFVFDNDPFLNEKEKKSMQNRGGNGIVHLTKDNDGIWVGKRDIVLGLNIPNYR